MSRISFVNGIINRGYKEVERVDCPVDFENDAYY
jgi:hypothetical protein